MKIIVPITICTTREVLTLAKVLQSVLVELVRADHVRYVMYKETAPEVIIDLFSGATSGLNVKAV